MYNTQNGKFSQLAIALAAARERMESTDELEAMAATRAAFQFAAALIGA